MSLVRLRIPTLLHGYEGEPDEEPWIEVAGLGETFLASPHQVVHAAAWLRFAHAWLGHAGSLTLAEALDATVAALAGAPPRRVDDTRVGAVAAESSAGQPVALLVIVEHGVNERASPRIRLDVATADRPPDCGDSWWLLDAEARRLGAILRAGEAGQLVEAGPNARPWLHVGARGAGSVRLRFDDDLVAEAGGDGVVVLGDSAAATLANALDEAVRLAETRAPYVFTSAERKPRTVAEISLAGR
jgi:hypothetical protein